MMKVTQRQLYDAVPGYHFTKRGYDLKTPIEEYFETKEYEDTEERILKGLYLYQCLNLKNLTLYVGRPIKDHVQKMILQGVIDYFSLESDIDQTPYEKAEQGSALRPYVLSKKAHRFMIDNRTYPKTYTYPELERMTDEEILKKLSVNQYHINLIKKNKDIIKSAKIGFTDTYREKGTVKIPSLIQLKDGPTLFAFPMYRTPEEYTETVRLLLKMAGYLVENKENYPAPILIWVAKSNKAAMDGITKIRKIKELQDLTLCYVLDYCTKEGNPLDELITAEEKSEGVELFKVSVI